MLNNFQGEKYNYNYKYNKIRKKYDTNSSTPNWRRNIELSSNTPNNSMLSENLSLPYLSPNKNEGIKIPSFNSYQPGDQNNFIKRNNSNFSANYAPNIYPNNKNNLVFGLPLIVHKAYKYNEKVFTPKIAKNNSFSIKGIKKNYSNFVETNVIREDISDTPKNNSFKKYKKPNDRINDTGLKFYYDKYLKKNRTEEYLDDKGLDYFLQMKRNRAKRWWILLHYFMRIYSFLYTLRKYTKRLKLIRRKQIGKMEDYLIEDINIVRNWMIELQGNYWGDLLHFKNFNTSFKEFDPIDKITRKSKVLIQLLYNYIYNLIDKTSHIDQIPEDIQEIIYKYIKKNAYYPRKYLNLFHIKRFKFDFYGSCLNNTIKESSMNLSYFLICCISVQQIFLNIKFIFNDLKIYENIFIACKYIASILYYLERNTFIYKMKINNSYIDLFNYYRCYKITNKFIEKEDNIDILLGIEKNENIIKHIDTLDIEKVLINDKVINKFCGINFNMINKISNSLFSWSNNLTKLILKKFNRKYII